MYALSPALAVAAVVVIGIDCVAKAAFVAVGEVAAALVVAAVGIANSHTGSKFNKCQSDAGRQHKRGLKKYSVLIQCQALVDLVCV